MKIEIPAAWRDNQDKAREYHGVSYEEKALPFRQAIRAAMQDGFTLEAVVALTVAGAESGPQPIINRMLAFAAACDVADQMEGTVEERLAEAEEAAPVKGKKAKKPGKGAKGGNPDHSWAGTIGKGGVWFSFSPGPIAKDLLFELLEPLQFVDLGRELVEGVCDPSYAHGLDMARAQLSFEGCYVVGWRMDRRSVAAGTLKAAVQKKIKEEEAQSGKVKGKAERKEIRTEVAFELLKKAVPATTVVPMVIMPEQGRILFGGPAKSATAFAEKLKLPGLERWSPAQLVPADLKKALEGIPEATKLTVAPLKPGNGWSQYVGADFLMWLLLPCPGGNGTADLSWKVAGKVALIVPDKESGKSATVVVSSTDTGALHAALAEGATVASLRLEVAESYQPVEAKDGDGEPVEASLQRAYFFDIDSRGKITGIGLPASKGLQLAANVWERSTLTHRLSRIVQDLYMEFALTRTMGDQWESVWKDGREWVGLQMARRYFQAQDGQLSLFQIPGTRAIEGGE